MLATLSESRQTSQRALSAAAWLMLALLLALAAWTGARAFWSLMAVRHSPAIVATDSASAAQPALGNANAPDTDLAALHLFGQAGLPAAPVAIQVPDTTLRLTLLGTAAADNPESGGAIVSDDSGAQGYYLAGDELPGGATLREVYPDHVILGRQGRRESLRLDRDETSAPSGPATIRSRPDRRVANTSTASSASPNADWSSIQQSARLDPQKLMQLGSQIRALPFTENGKPIGVRLVASRDATMIRRLGLRSSDVIMSVNGIPLTDASRQFELMRLLDSSSQFQVRIRRNGSPMTVTVDASTLTSN